MAIWASRARHQTKKLGVNTVPPTTTEKKQRKKHPTPFITPHDALQLPRFLAKYKRPHKRDTKQGAEYTKKKKKKKGQLFAPTHSPFTNIRGRKSTMLCLIPAGGCPPFVSTLLNASCLNPGNFITNTQLTSNRTYTPPRKQTEVRHFSLGGGVIHMNRKTPK